MVSQMSESSDGSIGEGSKIDQASMFRLGGIGLFCLVTVGGVLLRTGALQSIFVPQIRPSTQLAAKALSEFHSYAGRLPKDIKEMQERTLASSDGGFHVRVGADAISAIRREIAMYKLEVLWNHSCFNKPGETSSGEKILAFEPSAKDSRGWVIFANGKVKLASKKDFPNLAQPRILDPNTEVLVNGKYLTAKNFKINNKYSITQTEQPVLEDFYSELVKVKLEYFTSDPIRPTMGPLLVQRYVFESEEDLKVLISAWIEIVSQEWNLTPIQPNEVVVNNAKRTTYLMRAYIDSDKKPAVGLALSRQLADNKLELIRLEILDASFADEANQRIAFDKEVVDWLLEHNLE